MKVLFNVVKERINGRFILDRQCRLHYYTGASVYKYFNVFGFGLSKIRISLSQLHLHLKY